jgi:hypothetical protein
LLSFRTALLSRLRLLMLGSTGALRLLMLHCAAATAAGRLLLRSLRCGQYGASEQRSRGDRYQEIPSH